MTALPEGVCLPRKQLYFLTYSRRGAPIKIGSANNVKARVKTLQTAFPYKMKILLVYDGTMAEERRIHKQFKQQRLRGEWFRRSEALLRFIEEHKVRF